MGHRRPCCDGGVGKGYLCGCSLHFFAGEAPAGTDSGAGSPAGRAEVLAAFRDPSALLPEPCRKEAAGI